MRNKLLTATLIMVFSLGFSSPSLAIFGVGNNNSTNVNNSASNANKANTNIAKVNSNKSLKTTKQIQNIQKSTNIASSSKVDVQGNSDQAMKAVTNIENALKPVKEVERINQLNKELEKLQYNQGLGEFTISLENSEKYSKLNVTIGLRLNPAIENAVSLFKERVDQIRESIKAKLRILDDQQLEFEKGSGLVLGTLIPELNNEVGKEYILNMFYGKFELIEK